MKLYFYDQKIKEVQYYFKAGGQGDEGDLDVNKLYEILITDSLSYDDKDYVKLNKQDDNLVEEFGE